MADAKLQIRLLSDNSVDLYIEKGGERITKVFNLQGTGLEDFFDGVEKIKERVRAKRDVATDYEY